MNNDAMLPQTPNPDEGSAPQPTPAPGAPEATGHPAAGTPEMPVAAPAARPEGSAPPPAIPPAGVAPASAEPARSRMRWWLVGAAAAIALVGVGCVAYAIGQANADNDLQAVDSVHLTAGTRPSGSALNVSPGSGDTHRPPAGSPQSLHLGDGSEVLRVGVVYDNHADLEIADQRGDGRSVRIESVRTSIGSGFVVIAAKDGTVLGTAPVSSGTQPVTVTLTTPLTGSGKAELYGSLWADNGDGRFDSATDSIVVERDHDDHGREQVAEDFDYWVK